MAVVLKALNGAVEFTDFFDAEDERSAEVQRAIVIYS